MPSTKDFKTLTDKITTDPTRNERMERAREELIAEHVDFALGEVRRIVGLTQVELASALHIPQSNVSRIENGDDVLLSTLRRYVEACGGRLELKAVFGNGDLAVRI